MTTNLTRKFKIFIDFDGTITKQDVGENMFLKFGDKLKAYQIIDRWINKEITSTESWQQLCDSIIDFDENAFDQFINQIEIDEYFIDFYQFCQNNQMDVFVLSDGLDYYIKKFFNKYSLSNINFFSNIFTLNSSNKIIPQFNYRDEDCKFCANCKRNHIIDNSSDDDFTIYIGDGYSDTCPAQFVDYLFAKNSLLKFCEKNRISYFPFKNFSDIKNIVSELITKKRLKKRHQAFLKRKEVYMRG